MGCMYGHCSLLLANVVEGPKESSRSGSVFILVHYRGWHGRRRTLQGRGLKGKGTDRCPALQPVGLSSHRTCAGDTLPWEDSPGVGGSVPHSDCLAWKGPGCLCSENQPFESMPRGQVSSIFLAILFY